MIPEPVTDMRPIPERLIPGIPITMPDMLFICGIPDMVTIPIELAAAGADADSGAVDLIESTTPIGLVVTLGTRAPVDAEATGPALMVSGARAGLDDGDDWPVEVAWYCIPIVNESVDAVGPWPGRWIAA